jgi:hypothetical protein
MNTLANVDTMEKLLQGSGGFVLGVVFCVFFYVKFILPRHDRLTAASERVADAMREIAMQMQGIVEQQKVERHESFDKIIELLKKP